MANRIGSIPASILDSVHKGLGSHAIDQHHDGNENDEGDDDDTLADYLVMTDDEDEDEGGEERYWEHGQRGVGSVNAAYIPETPIK
jgi:hypothetical protein